MHFKLFNWLVCLSLLMLVFTVTAQEDEEDLNAAPELPAAEESTPAEAAVQAGGDCPILVDESFTATELVCEGLTLNQACFGNGIIEAVGKNDAELTFGQAGDREILTDIESLRLRSTGTESNNWTVAVMRAAMNTTGDESVDVSLVAFGDLTLTDSTVQPTTVSSSIGTVRAAGGLNVRREPGAAGTLIWQLGNSETVTAIGLTEDRQWVRIIIPNEFQGIGWVYAPYLDVEGGAERLPRADQNSPVPDIEAPDVGALRNFTLQSRTTDPACSSTPDSGLLMQSPSGVLRSIEFTVNDVQVRFSGTIFLQAQAGGGLTMSVLEGDGRLLANNTEQDLGVSEESTVPIDTNLQANGTPTASRSIESERIQFVPVRLLPRQFNLGSIVTDSGESDAAADVVAQEIPSESAQSELSDENICVLTAVNEARNLRAGPGTEFNEVGLLGPGQTIVATGQARDSNNFIWYQTENLQWIRMDTVEATEPCATLPQGVLPASAG